MQLDVDRRQDMLRQYIERHESHGQQEGSQSKTNVENHQQKHYSRYVARGPSGQKLTKEASGIEGLSFLDLARRVLAATR